MTRDPAVLAYARQVADDWGPFGPDEVEFLSRVIAPQIRAIRARSNDVRPIHEAA